MEGEINTDVIENFDQEHEMSEDEAEVEVGLILKPVLYLKFYKLLLILCHVLIKQIGLKRLFNYINYFRRKISMILKWKKL